MSETAGETPRSEFEHPQNFGRRLTLKEFDDIQSTLASFHFAKESLSPEEKQLLYAAEALHREVTMLIVDNPLPLTE